LERILASLRPLRSGACLGHRARPICMPGGAQSGRVAVLSAAGALAIILSGCAATATGNGTPTSTPSASASAADPPTPSPTAAPTPSLSASASATPTPTGVDPGFVPALAAIQM